MKKVFSVLVAVLVLTSVAAAFAAPVVPPQSLGNVSEKAGPGLHEACHNVHYVPGVAHDVFMLRLCPHGME